MPLDKLASSQSYLHCSDQMLSERSYRLGHQSWTASNLFVHSYHDEIAYFTTRWDALCPYIDVNEAMLRVAPQPLLIYALPPESEWGHPIRDAYGLVAVREEGYWTEGRRARKFKELRQKHRRFDIACSRYRERCSPPKILRPGEVSILLVMKLILLR